MGAFDNLGQALRWLRSRQHKKQYEIADRAGITKAMLSAYETGKQNPSIETLEKILDALACNLSELHNALVLHQDGRPPEIGLGSGMTPWDEARSRAAGGRVSVYDVIDGGGLLPPDWERSLTQMLEGFHSLVRHMHRQLERTARVQPFPGPRGAGGGPRRLEGTPAPAGDEDEGGDEQE